MSMNYVSILKFNCCRENSSQESRILSRTSLFAYSGNFRVRMYFSLPAKKFLVEYKLIQVLTDPRSFFTVFLKKLIEMSIVYYVEYHV